MSCKYETEFCKKSYHCQTCPFDENLEITLTEEQLDKLVEATNFARYVNSAINYNGRLPTDEEYEKLQKAYYNLRE